jgi:hypothetical protein
MSVQHTLLAPDRKPLLLNSSVGIFYLKVLKIFLPSFNSKLYSYELKVGREEERFLWQLTSQLQTKTSTVFLLPIFHVKLRF